MMYYLRLGLILLVFCAVAAGILAYLNTLTAPVIAERKANEEIDTRAELIPGAVFTQHTSAEGDIYFTATSAEDSTQVLGYTFVCAQKGYSSSVQTMVGVDPDFNILAVKVIDQAETPGLGANCQQASFTGQFKGLALPKIKVDKDGGEIVSLSGATITSRAVANSVHDGIKAIQKDLEAE